MTRLAPFGKLLVANRGEIAVRILRTARAMGLRTVAVYSEADDTAEHVRLADEAVLIGPGPAAQSYLRIDAIIEAARATGADAIHPGYGFLAENPGLPSACDAAGIVFVGPGADAIRTMGDKAAAKALMTKAGVPCVPGYDGADQSLERLEAEARRIGFPVMIKAAAGGGGRGMRLVASADAFPDALGSARSEAAAAFGNGAVLLEKAIPAPRHVEIQIMADRNGNVVHLGERDCSVQRRHQKIIEEAPSPAVTPDLRARMGDASVSAAKAIGYVGAGTFEYLLDSRGHFWFIEMNTRLQVEHPVTEAITGLDLVELQLRVASGEDLPLRQEDIVFSGHAIEARLCAEDARAGFLPQSGTLALWHPPPSIRVEHGLRSGCQVPPHYDSMIAKLIAHGPTREDARRRLLAALDATRAIGLRTNGNFLAACLSHPVFAAGGATTAFIEDHGGALNAAEAQGEAQAAMIAAALLRAGSPNRLTHGFPAPLRLSRDATEYRPIVQVLRDGHCHVEMSDHPPIDLQVMRIGELRTEFEIMGIRRAATLFVDDTGVTIHLDGQCHDFLDLTFQPIVTGGSQHGDGRIRALMNGTVVSVDVAVGDKVEAGQQLVVIEAMKMEHPHSSMIAGQLTAVHVEPGMQVSTHTMLVEVEAD